MIGEICKANNKCYWGIDMNDGKQPYLVTYYWIDYIDHMIKNFWMKYQSYKYKDVPMLHAM